METTYLKHYGIQGQKWGQRNGPPYPLKAGDHSAAEKRAARATYGKVVKSKVKYGGIKDMTSDELKNANSRSAQEAQYMKNNSQGMKNDRKASDMSTAELQAYNSRRQAEDQYKDFQKKDREKAIEERVRPIKNAKAIVDDVNNINKAVDKSLNDYFNDKHKARKAAMDLSKYSDEELRRAVNRMNLEKQYRDLTPNEISRGERVAANIFRTTGTVLTTSSTALDIALKFKELID